MMPTVGRWRKTHFWLAVVILCFGSSYAETPRFSFFGRKSNSSSVAASAAASTSSDSSWSNFFTIDPSKILYTIVHRGGLILPKSIQEELLAIAKVCHVDEVQWNPVQKQLLLTNVTVTSPGMEEPSLRVGRLFVSWESYTKPCLNIELDDVDVLLEFTNLLLTKNNWHELYQAGFPPPMMVADAGGEDEPLATYSFVRIGSMDLSGMLQAQIRSRPLGDREVCPPWILDLDTFDEWNTELQRLSHQNLVRTGRRGCTTLQMYDWLETYVGGKLRTVLSSTAYDLANQPFSETDTDTVRRAKGFLKQARKTVFSYATHASKKTGKDLQDNVMGRLDSLGIKDTVGATVSKLGAIRMDLNETDFDESLTKIRATYQSLRDAANQRLNYVKGALKAAEEADAGHPEVVFPPDR